MSNIGFVLGLRWAASFFFGVTITAASNLMIEQVPQFRGAAMALSSAFRGMGVAFGIAVAGAVLNLYVDTIIGFQMLGVTVAVFAFASALIALFFTKDPLRV
jgi:MFS family permease